MFGHGDLSLTAVRSRHLRTRVFAQPTPCGTRNPQSSDYKSDTLSIRPRGPMHPPSSGYFCKGSGEFLQFPACHLHCIVFSPHCDLTQGRSVYETDVPPLSCVEACCGHQRCGHQRGKRKRPPMICHPQDADAQAYRQYGRTQSTAIGYMVWW